MSLVQAFIYKDFILVCGEQRANLDDGIVVENFIKVRKLNSTTIIAMTGTIEGNAKLFIDYINPDFTVKENVYNQTYNDVERCVIENFYNNYDYFQIKSVHSIICGWNGQKMTGKAIFTKDENDPDMNPINDLTPAFPEHVRFISCGLDQHRINAETLGKEKQCVNILQFKNLFKDVIELGIKFDDSINNNLTFEKIRRIDVNEEYHK